MTLELPLDPRHERAVGNKAVERIAHEGELEERPPLLRVEVGADLFETEMSMTDPGQLGHRKLSLHKQSDLLHVLSAHMLAQRPADRMRARLGNGNEDEFVQRGDDHRPANLGAHFSWKTATHSG